MPKLGQFKRDWSDLEELYIGKGLSIRQIAKSKGIDQSQVCTKLKWFKIKPRGHKEAALLWRQRTKKYDFNYGDLKHLYIDNALSSAAIAKLYSCAAATVIRALKQFNIPRRTASEAGILLARKAEHSSGWKGGRFKTKSGYIFLYVPNHPHAKRGYIQEHRLILENHLGRLLNSWEVVHHLNGKKDDNRIGNLQLLPTNKEHIPSIATQRRLNKLEMEIVELKKQIKLLEWQLKQQKVI